MDVYDPQMPNVVLFGGLMVVSAIGIFLVFTFMEKVLRPSEEALAKQGKGLKKTQQKEKEKKKKEEAVEKKGKGKKNQEKPNGQVPEAHQSAPVVSSVTIKKSNVLPAHEEQKHNGPVKKVAASKKKSEPAPADSDGPLYLPYKTLVSTVSSTVFGEGEAQRLIEILTEKAGIVQDTWHAAKQKGDPVTVLKRQLEEKEKQLATKQEAAAAARNKVEELSQELAAERAKATAVEGKLKEQLLAREQEMAAVQARVQASYQDHVSETQQLQGKIRTLQEQLENGPDTQLARLQQENSILSDAFCQIRSQMESKQNAEVARLQEWCGKLMNELSEKSEVLRQEEQLRKSWKMKVAALERQMEQLQEKLGKKKKRKNRGQAASELQERLKVTQDQLAKGRLKKCKEQLQETGEEDSLKEGTSV
ncbi:ribosome-binding protein 1-like [Falco biarmicus]|uniref:ribosome-binding protein 1-like n=1 Tax=Falco biarmicus TaxID=345155 RepID=UPI0024BC11DC|nr:ribosome-binding protein 1-like [Falco biarmicus]XP_056217846.1 ribosome-binding protein 1-like [Falco biarmicus]